MFSSFFFYFFIIDIFIIAWNLQSLCGLCAGHPFLNLVPALFTFLTRKEMVSLPLCISLDYLLTSYISFLGSGQRASLSLLPCQWVQALHSPSSSSSNYNNCGLGPLLRDTGWHSLLRWVWGGLLRPLFPPEAGWCFPVPCWGPLHAFLCFNVA